MNFVSSLIKGKNFNLQKIDNLDSIVEELSEWILQQNDLKISQTMPLEYLDNLPYTKQEIQKFGNPLKLTYWVVKPYDRIPCHIDGVMEHFGIPRSRLLIPVINCKNTETIFYENTLEVEDFKDPRAGLQYIRPKNESALIESERFVLDEPAWMRIDRLHSVVNHSDTVRISFTVFYDKETQIKYTPK